MIRRLTLPLALAIAFAHSPVSLARTTNAEPEPQWAGAEIDRLVFRELLSRLGHIKLDVDGYYLTLAEFLSRSMLSRPRTAVSVRNRCEVFPSPGKYRCKLTLATYSRPKKSPANAQHSYTLEYIADGDGQVGIGLPGRIKAVDFWRAKN